MTGEVSVSVKRRRQSGGDSRSPGGRGGETPGANRHPLREAATLVHETFSAWRRDDTRTWGAALAYYAVVSLPPLVLVLLSLLGVFVGDEAARGTLFRWTGRLLGPQGNATVRTVVETAPDAPGLVGAGSVVFLLVLGTRAFAQLQKAMNELWGVEWPGRGVAAFVRGRLLGLLAVLALGALFVLVVAASAAVSFLAPVAARVLPGISVVLVPVNLALTFLVVAGLFAAFFRILPDVRISWGDVWVGAAVSAALFLIGSSLLGAFVGTSTIASAYGAASSLLGLLVWFYYSVQVYFFGAELTRVWARRSGSEVEPARGAVLRRAPDRRSEYDGPEAPASGSRDGTP